MISTICPNCGKTCVEGDTFCGACGWNVTPPPPSSISSAGTMAGVRLSDGDDLLLEKLRESTLGEYEVRGLLGRGGMASVFVAYDLTLNRRVALKAMHPGLLGDAGMRDRFRLEARLSARLAHPNIVTVHAVKERGNIVFFDLKLIEGTSLDRLMRFHGAPLPVNVARWVTAKIADALHYAHTEGVVHRDVKPANVMVDKRGDPTVTDFGIAKATESPHLTMTGAVVGTPAYMSPEQCLGAEITAASDQYSLGILAYELLTGQVPFSGSMLTIQLGHVEKIPTPPCDVVVGLAKPVSDIVMRMIAKDPKDRWPSLGAVAEVMMNGMNTTEAAVKRELGLLIAELPPEATTTFPLTPRSPTPLTNAPRSSQPGDALRPGDSGSGRNREWRASSASLPAVEPVKRPLEPTPVVSMEAVERDRDRQKLLRLGSIAAVAVLVVGLVSARGILFRGDTGTATPATTAPGDSAAPAVAGATSDVSFDPTLDVSDSTVARIALDPIRATLAVGDSMPLKATPYGPSGEPVRARVRWSSDDSTTVRVSADGWIHAVKRGGPVFINASTGTTAATRKIGIAIVTVQ